LVTSRCHRGRVYQARRSPTLRLPDAILYRARNDGSGLLHAGGGRFLLVRPVPTIGLLQAGARWSEKSRVPGSRAWVGACRGKTVSPFGSSAYPFGLLSAIGRADIIEGFYNSRRGQSVLDYRRPNEVPTVTNSRARPRKKIHQIRCPKSPQQPSPPAARTGPNILRDPPPTTIVPARRQAVRRNV
jgi:hypothetical protein